MSDGRHIRSLVMVDKKGKQMIADTDLFNYELEKQLKGWKIERERDVKGTKQKVRNDDDDDL